MALRRPGFENATYRPAWRSGSCHFALAMARGDLSPHGGFRDAPDHRAECLARVGVKRRATTVDGTLSAFTGDTVRPCGLRDKGLRACRDRVCGDRKMRNQDPRTRL